MNTIKAELLLASTNACTGDTLYTWLLLAPRVILPEIGTHRMFSRNTSSSRAIPGWKQRKIVWEDPFVPVYLGQAQKGMQTGPELAGWRRAAAKYIWKTSRLPQLAAAWGMEKLGVHKAIVNRLIEPYTWSQILLSATEIENFFWLRDHHMAEPHFQELAAQMHDQAAYAQTCFNMFGETATIGDPRLRVLHPGEWHLPFIEYHEREAHDVETLKKISAARCARTSYFLPENGTKSDLKRDLELFERLAVRDNGSDDPRHLSPLEHQAQAIQDSVYVGNFRGFKQFRKEIANESGIKCAQPTRTLSNC